MPRYDWTCPNGHRHEHVSSYERRDEPRACVTCGAPATREFPHPHCPPSGVYSYEPNVGSADAFEYRREAMKAGQKVIPKYESHAQRERRLNGD